MFAPRTVACALTVLMGAALSAQGPGSAGNQPPRPDNYYATGNRVEITAPKPGDVVVAGRRVEIRQPVHGDILAAGWRVDLSGRAEDDVRIAGAEVSINEAVSGDLNVAGGEITLAPQSSVEGRTWITGNAVRLDGVCGGDVHIAAAVVEIGGEIRKPLEVVADRLEFLPAARILAPVSYRSPREARIAQGAVINGPVTFDRIRESEVRQARALGGVSSFLFAVHLLLAGFLVLRFMPSVETNVVAALRASPGKSVLAGFVLLISTPAAALMLVLSVVGLPIGLALVALYAVTLFAAVLAAAFCLGDAELRLFGSGPPSTRGQHALMLLVGVLTLAMLRSLLGGLVVFASILFGLGALALAAYAAYVHRVPQPA